MKSQEKFLIISLIILIFLGGGIFWYFQKTSQRPPQENLQPKFNSITTMKLSSPVFENNGFIPAKYTCDGEDINPPLTIAGAPKETESFVLIIDDPDAPMGTWDHWIVWNIEPTISQIQENQVPSEAVEGLNDFKRHSYGGPCPPSGVHHYHFKLYALDKKLDIAPSSKKEDVEKAMENSILGQTELIGLYRRK